MCEERARAAIQCCVLPCACLCKGTSLTQLEIGERVGCSSSHVAVLMDRIRQHGDNAQVVNWMEEFRKRTLRTGP